MSYACMNGRLKMLPLMEYDETSENKSDEITVVKSHISVTPCKFPHGLITVYELSPATEWPIISDEIMQDDIPSSSPKLVEVHRFKGEVIIDHCWMCTESKFSKSGRVLILATITRKRGDNIPLNNANGYTEKITSTLHVQWRDNYPGNLGETMRHSIDDTFSHKRAIALDFIANSVLMNKKLLVIGSSNGAIFHKIEDFIMDQQDHEESLRIQQSVISSIKILSTFMVHAMDLSDSCFVAVSGERVGTWCTKNILDTFESGDNNCTADWSGHLNDQGRITSVKLSIECDDYERYFALSSWDGSALIFRKENNSHWSRVGKKIEEEKSLLGEENNIVSPPWEQTIISSQEKISPTFVCFSEYCHRGTGRLAMIVSTPNSACMRMVDMKRELCFEIRKGSGTEVQGVASTMGPPQGGHGLSGQGVAFIDGEDKIFVLNLIRNDPLPTT